MAIPSSKIVTIYRDNDIEINVEPVKTEADPSPIDSFVIRTVNQRDQNISIGIVSTKNSLLIMPFTEKTFFPEGIMPKADQDKYRLIYPGPMYPLPVEAVEAMQAYQKGQ